MIRAMRSEWIKLQRPGVRWGAAGAMLELIFEMAVLTSSCGVDNGEFT